MSPEQIKLYAPLIAIAVMIPLVLLRNRRPRKLNVNLLWIAPALVTLGIAMGLTFGRPPGVAFTWLEGAIAAVSLALGAAAGWWRGKMMRMEVDPSDRTVTAQTSPAGLIFIVVLFGVRHVLRLEAESGVVSLGFHPAVLVEALMLFAVAMVIVQRVELWIRANRLLSAARPSAA